jgi:hypothetical protein
MRHLLIVGGLLVIGLVAPLQGAAYKCVSEPCGRDEKGNIIKTPSCCKDLSCDFGIRRVDAWAKERVFSNPVAGAAAIEAVEELGGDREEAYAGLLRLADRSPIRGGFGPCDEHHPEPRLMQVDDSDEDCPIVTIDGAKTPVTLEDALRDSNTCEEYVRAEYARMQKRQEFCLQFGPASERSFEHLAREAGIEYGEQARSMEATKAQHIRACTNPPPPDDDLVPLVPEIIDELVPLTPDRTPKLKKKATPKTKSAPKRRSTGAGSR